MLAIARHIISGHATGLILMTNCDACGHGDWQHFGDWGACILCSVPGEWGPCFPWEFR